MFNLQLLVIISTREAQVMQSVIKFSEDCASAIKCFLRPEGVGLAIDVKCRIPLPTESICKILGVSILIKREMDGSIYLICV